MVFLHPLIKEINRPHRMLCGSFCSIPVKFPFEEYRLHRKSDDTKNILRKPKKSHVFHYAISIEL